MKFERISPESWLLIAETAEEKRFIKDFGEATTSWLARVYVVETKPGELRLDIDQPTPTGR